MSRILLGLATSAMLASAASAQTAPRRAIVPPHASLSADELRDYHQEQTERRQEMERAALRMNQQSELRARGLDDDDDD